MVERQVFINVSREFREQIKTLKRELTYQEYFDYLLKNAKGKNNSPSVTNPRTTKDGNIK